MPTWMGQLRRALSRPPVVRNLETITIAPIWGERFHASPRHELAHVLNGHARIELLRADGEARSFDVGPEDTFVIPQGTSHRDVRVGESPYRVLYVFFHWPGADAVIEGLNPDALSALPAGAKSQLHMKMREIEGEYIGDVRGARQRIRVMLLETLLALARHSQRARYAARASKSAGNAGDAKRRVAEARRKRLAADVRQYLLEHFDQPLALEDLAERFRVSPFHLCRTFTREFGTSMTDLLTLTRIERAKEMLDSGDWSVKEVAHRSGFSDANYFAKVFRKVTGLSPSEYRLSRTKSS